MTKVTNKPKKLIRLTEEQDIVDLHTQEVLLPFLINHIPTAEAIQATIMDVEERLRSILTLWDKKDFINTLLFLGLEESTFYVPRVSPIIGSLVVVGVRNSHIENLNSTIEAANSLGLDRPYLTDETVKQLTRKSLMFFDKYKPDKYHKGVKHPQLNHFLSLPLQYPMAWMVLSHLATMVNKNKKAIYGEFEKPNLPPNTESFKAYLEMNTAKGVDILPSGMSYAMTPLVKHYLALIEAGETELFYAPSLINVSRNPSILLRVIDFVLSKGVEVLTDNYVLATTSVHRRLVLVKPSEVGGKRTFPDTKGLSPLHKHLLDVVKFTVHEQAMSE